MTKAGPWTRAVSKRVELAETPVGNTNHIVAAQTSFEASPQPPTELGHVRDSDEVIIGLALGSPRQNPILALPPDDHDVNVTCVCSSPKNPAGTLRDVCEIGSGSEGVKRKGSKWKSLGSFFGRREVRSTSPFYQLDRKRRSEPAEEPIIQGQLKTNALGRKRANSNHVSKAHQADLSTGTAGEESGGLLRRASSRRKGLRRRNVKEPRPEMQRIPAEYTAHAIAERFGPHVEHQSIPRSPLLQVEIPCVELDRYSVMFGDVLKPQTRQSKPQPSLRVRRQAHFEELHTVAGSNSKPFDLALSKPGLRGDSIAFKSSNSPSFSLFPSTSPHSAHSLVDQQLVKPCPLSHSVTEPSRLLFPPKPAIKKSKSHDHDQILFEGVSETSTSLEGQSIFDPSERSADSAATSNFECAEYPRYSYLSLEADTLIPTTGALHESLQRAFPIRKSSMKKLDTAGPRYRHQGEDPISPSAEVSVARQISISRRQRQFLVPISPKTARQPIQLRVKGQGTTDESRRSHHVTLEDA